MWQVVLERVVQGLVVMLLISALAFSFTHLSGDPVAAMLPPDATQQEIEELRKLLDLDRPVWEQYLKFLKRAVVLDLGPSARYRVEALQMVRNRFPATLLLAVASTTLTILIALPVGIISAVRRGSLLDKIATILIVLGQAIPGFWFGIMLILLFAVNFGLLPSFGFDSYWAIVLPATALALHSCAVVTRLVRTSMLEVIWKDYVKTARSKGLHEFWVICRHGLRNALIPVVTLLGVQFGAHMGRAVVTETVFAWPGIGNLMVEAIMNQDVALVQACVITITFFITLVNLGVDISYGFLDPRTRTD
jgi:ABC-type dipeptide/oligopeptide/nickel transport system permease component